MHFVSGWYFYILAASYLRRNRCRDGPRNLRTVPPLPFLTLPLSFPSPPLRSRTLKPARGSGERCKLPSGVRGGAQAENEFSAL